MANRQPALQVEGLPQLRRAFRQLEAGLEDLKDANQAVATLVATGSAGRAPRRTGTLAGSVRGNRAAATARVMAGGARAPYAGPVHWGWPARHLEAQPFIADTAVATEPVWLAMYARDVDQAVAAATAHAHP